MIRTTGIGANATIKAKTPAPDARTARAEKGDRPVVACLGFRQISFSVKSDSEETIREIRDHNARFRAACGI
ncbi:MAG: hypothetical protein H2045_09150 [Rhizobiales bacterium]|nr:hypothetical protein [Hyphomicrobiales bacterium]